LLDYLDDARRSLGDADSKRRGDAVAYRDFRKLRVEFKCPACIGARPHPSEQQVCIRHRRLRAAEPVTCGTRDGARPLRANVKNTCSINSGNRTAASSDGVDFNRGDKHLVVADSELVGNVGLPPSNEQHVTTGAPDLHGYHVTGVQAGTNVFEGANARSWPGKRECDRFPYDLIDAASAAVVFHQ